MVFTRRAAGKIWSSIYMQNSIKLALQYQTINLTRFLCQICLAGCNLLHYQINLIKITIYIFKAERRIKKPVKHLGWKFLRI